MASTEHNKRKRANLVEGLKLIRPEAKSLEDKRKQYAFIDEVRYSCPMDINIELTPNVNNQRRESMAREAFRILAAKLGKL
ncbi:hypothetical protein KA005_25580 [bacterium]|nr:hypothetical protein [bacterium]